MISKNTSEKSKHLFTLNLKMLITLHLLYLLLLCTSFFRQRIRISTYSTNYEPAFTILVILPVEGFNFKMRCCQVAIYCV